MAKREQKANRLIILFYSVGIAPGPIVSEYTEINMEAMIDWFMLE